MSQSKNTVLVTGGASGIGRAVVEAMLAEGWRAIVADHNAATIAVAQSELAAHAASLRFETLDISDEAAVVRTVADCVSQFGPITGLVNCAGIGSDIGVMDTTVEIMRRMLEVNLIGGFVVSREVARAMQASGGGSIVNVASVSALIGNEGRVAYGASKGGIVTMTKVMAVELATDNIRVNVIAPGPIETPLVSVMHSAAMRATWMKRVPLGRYGRPEEVASVIAFLLDGEKSGYVTGQTISVDGGFTSAGLYGLNGKTEVEQQ